MERPNHPLAFYKIGFLLAAVSTWLFLTGCGPGFEPKSFYHKTITDMAPTADSQDPLFALTGEVPDYTTGAYKVVPSQDGQAPQKLPYVAAGNSTLLNYLRSALGASANASFGATVQKVKVAISGSNVDVQITFADSTRPVDFRAPLKQKNQQMLALDMTPTQAAQNPLSLNLVCTDVTCSEIVMVLTKGANTKAGIIYRTSTPSVKFQNLNPDAANGYTVQTFKTLANEAGKITAKRVSVTVVPGISYSDIELQDPAKKNILSLDTDLVDTQDGSTQVSNVKSAYDQNVTGTLFANNPKTGTAMITLAKKVGKDSDEKLGLVITEAKQNQPDVVPDIVPNAPLAPPPAPDDNSDNSTANPPGTPSSATTQQSSTPPPPSTPPPSQAPGNGLFPMPDRAQNPEGYQMTLGFARYANDYYVREFVRAYLGQGPMRTCDGLRDKNAASPKSYRYTLLDFLRYAPAVAPYIDKITNFVGVSPNIGYLLALETSYATNDENPYHIAMRTARGSSALGPWQILYGTGLEISKSAIKEFGTQFTGFHVESSPKYWPVDDRTYFVNSTLMASLYIQTLTNLFPDEDPALAIMAYNAGDGTVTHARTYISNLTGGYNITFDDMIRRHVPIRLYCGAVAYTMRFLALQTIGQHPEVYGLSVAPAQSSAFMTRLKNPHSELPAQISL